MYTSKNNIYNYNNLYTNYLGMSFPPKMHNYINYDDYYNEYDNKYWGNIPMMNKNSESHDLTFDENDNISANSNSNDNKKRQELMPKNKIYEQKRCNYRN